MSTDVTMQELELETAELLPARETLSCGYCAPLERLSQRHQRDRQHEPESGAGYSVSAFNGERQLPQHPQQHPVAPARLAPLALLCSA